MQKITVLSLTIKEQAEKAKQGESLTALLTDFSKNALSVQDQAHNILVASTCYAYKWLDTSYVEKFLNTSLGIKFLSTDGVAYWVRQIAGFTYKYDKASDQFTNVAFNRDKDFKSEQNVVFTFDKDHVACLKKDSNKFWKIAPHVHKELTLVTEWDRLTKPLTDKVARGLLAGLFTDEEVITHLTTLIDQVKTAKQDKKNKEWVAEYLAQNAKEEEVNPKEEV